MKKIKIIIMATFISGLLLGCNQEKRVSRYYKKNKALSDSIYINCKKIFDETGVVITIREQYMSNEIEVMLLFPNDNSMYYTVYYFDDLTYDKNCALLVDYPKNIVFDIFKITEGEYFKSILKLIVDSKYEGIYMWKDGVFIAYSTSNKNRNCNIGVAYYYNPENAVEGRFLKKIEDNVFLGHFGY